MTLNDRRELPTEHKEREEQTNENYLDDCVQYLARPQVVTHFIEVTVVRPPALISTPIVRRESQQHLKIFTHRVGEKNHIY